MPASAQPSPFNNDSDPAEVADLTDVDTLRLAHDRWQQQYHALAAFLGMASHELRAPINQVISLHQLILEDLCESPDEEREFIAQASQAMTRILKNLDTLISLSKLDIGALEPAQTPISLGKVLANVRQFTEMQCINRQCRLWVNPGPEAPSVLSDESWLTQALLSWVEAALAAGSTAITLEVLAQGTSTVTLGLTCNPPAHPWPPPLDPTIHPQPSPPSPHPSPSPGFGYHLTQRLLGHLHTSVRTTPGPSPDQHTLLIDLPTPDDPYS